MREILFRGKSLKTGKWTQGYLFRCWERAYIAWGMVNDNADMIEVDPETVCQYTGLTDKSGRKIFEGDIVKHFYDSKILSKVNVGIISWNESKCGFHRSSREDNCFYKITDYCKYEVIGNIFDNPELLEVENETD